MHLATNNTLYDDDDIVWINKLNKLGPGFRYSEVYENRIGHLIETTFSKLKFSDQTFGKNADYDYKLADVTIEQKISGQNSNVTNTQFEISLEYERNDGKPSGISVSKSQAFLFITPGFSGSTNTIVGKMRLFPTLTLKQQTPLLIQHGKIKQYGRDGRNSGARHVEFLSKNLPQIWLGDLPAVMENDHNPKKRKVLGYVVKNFVRYNEKLEKQMYWSDTIDFNNYYET